MKDVKELIGPDGMERALLVKRVQTIRDHWTLINNVKFIRDYDLEYGLNLITHKSVVKQCQRIEAMTPEQISDAYAALAGQDEQSEETEETYESTLGAA